MKRRGGFKKHFLVLDIPRYSLKMQIADLQLFSFFICLTSEIHLHLYLHLYEKLVFVGRTVTQGAANGAGPATGSGGAGGQRCCQPTLADGLWPTCGRGAGWVRDHQAPAPMSWLLCWQPQRAPSSCLNALLHFQISEDEKMTVTPFLGNNKNSLIHQKVLKTSSSQGLHINRPPLCNFLQPFTFLSFFILPSTAFSFLSELLFILFFYNFFCRTPSFFFDLD